MDGWASTAAPVWECFTTMLETRRASWRRGGALAAVSLLGLLAGCQDEDAFSLAAAQWSLSRQASKPQAASRAICENPLEAEAVVLEVLAAVNAKRAGAGLSPLRLDATLNRVADFYACRLVEDGFFAHEDPFDGSTVDVRAAHFGYTFQKIGENLAAGQLSVDQVMHDWMASPEHRANILDPTYTEIGIAVKLGGECGIYWVQEFGRPIVVAPNSTTTTSSGDESVSPADDATSSQSTAK